MWSYIIDMICSVGKTERLITGVYGEVHARWVNHASTPCNKKGTDPKVRPLILSEDYGLHPSQRCGIDIDLRHVVRCVSERS